MCVSPGSRSWLQSSLVRFPQDIADSSGVPLLNGAVGLALSILQTVSDARNNVSTCRDLATYTAEVVSSIHDAVKGIASVSMDMLKHAGDLEEYVHSFFGVKHMYPKHLVSYLHDRSLRGIKIDMDLVGKKSLWYQTLFQSRITARINLHQQNLERALSLFGVRVDFGRVDTLYPLII